jgi:hypothetical protein
MADSVGSYRNHSISTEKEKMRVTESRVTAAVCGSDMEAALADCHPVLKVMLKQCFQFYGDGNFSVGEDGSQEYCRWCGDGGKLFCCSACPTTFCEQCVKKLLARPC